MKAQTTIDLRSGVTLPTKEHVAFDVGVPAELKLPVRVLSAHQVGADSIVVDLEIDVEVVATLHPKSGKITVALLDQDVF